MEVDKKLVTEVRDALMVPAFKFYEIPLRAWKTLLRSAELFVLMILVSFSGLVFFRLPRWLGDWIKMDDGTKIVLIVLLIFLSAFCFFYLLVGLLKVLLDFTETGEMSYATAFADWRTILATSVTYALLYLVCFFFFGCCCFFLGLIPGTLFSQSYMLVLDRRSTVFASFGRSRKMIRHTEWHVFAIVLLQMGMWVGNQLMFGLVIPFYFMKGGPTEFPSSHSPLIHIPFALMHSIVLAAMLYMDVEMYRALLPRYLRRMETEASDDKPASTTAHATQPDEVESTGCETPEHLPEQQ